MRRKAEWWRKLFARVVLGRKLYREWLPFYEAGSPRPPQEHGR